MKLDLINREEDRQYIMENSSKNDLVDMLKQYGQVVDYFTESMVTDFFKVEKKDNSDTFIYKNNNLEYTLNSIINKYNA